ncbi:MAG: molybdopterin-dependent oxidoreductase [Halobacteriaceae archaeon]
MRLEPAPRVVDWTLFALVSGLVSTGIATALAGTAGRWWVFAAHTAGAVLFIVVLGWKLRRVASRLRPDAWTRGTWTSVLTGVLAVVALGTGIGWTLGAPVWVAGLSWLTIHAVVGVLLLAALLVHLRYRYHGLAAADFEGRRSVLRYALLAGLGGVAWRLQESVIELIWATRRYTGSRERGSFAGNAMPVTMWAADDPAPVDPEAWTLSIEGAVEERREIEYEALQDDRELRAVLDCTSGWYAVQDWRGVRVGDLLADVGETADARWVRFVSVTGYRWSLPIDEARDALLATHVSGEALDHGHGRPLRLVAPGRRGYQWVKWVETVEVRRTPDLGQWLAIFTSGFDE